MCGLRIRLLGDRVLHDYAWQVASQLGWPGTLAARDIAVTQLQVGALVTPRPQVARPSMFGSRR